MIAVKAVDVGEEEIITFYEGLIAKWQLPDRVISIDGLPLGVTGELVRVKLGAAFAGLLWNKDEKLEWRTNR